MGFTTFSDYPSPPGNKNFAIGEMTGPASYVTGVVATPPTGGIQIAARDLGLVEIEFIQFMVSDDGQYVIDVAPNTSGKSSATVTGLATVVNTGAQVANGTDISARKFRYWAVGR